MATRDSFLVTCEHGGNRVPAAYGQLFRQHDAHLHSHRGYDPGALAMARMLAGALAAPLVQSTTTRLLIDLNRSLHHPRVFSAATRTAPAALRARIVAEHYRPYRDEVERRVEGAAARGHRVIHVSSHSFTPALDGIHRRADVGLLYDPGRRAEGLLCARWKSSLAVLAPQLRVRRNYPYAGKEDGLTRHLRSRFPQRNYVGIELEINQAIVLAAGPAWMALRRVLVASLRAACAE